MFEALLQVLKVVGHCVLASLSGIPELGEMTVYFGPEHKITADLAFDDRSDELVGLPVAGDHVSLELAFAELFLAVVALDFLSRHRRVIIADGTSPISH
jgi:hypothetical protein